MSNVNPELTLLHNLLQEVDLQQFSSKIINELQVNFLIDISNEILTLNFDSTQVTKISHFEYVTAEDLMGIGLGRPAARRLLDTVNKKRKGTLRKKIFHSFVGSNSTKGKFVSGRKIAEASQSVSPNLTCLIKESVSKIIYKILSNRSIIAVGHRN